MAKRRAFSLTSGVALPVDSASVRVEGEALYGVERALERLPERFVRMTIDSPKLNVLCEVRRMVEMTGTNGRVVITWPRP